MTHTAAPLRLAAPAPARDEDEPIDDVAANQSGAEPGAGPESDGDIWLHEQCERLAWWCHSRRYYGSPRGPASQLGQLTAKARVFASTGPDAACDAELAAMYTALQAQPEALDRQVFELHYLQRVTNIKTAADRVGISRQHWYRLLRDFRRTLHRATANVMAMRDEERALLGRPRLPDRGDE